MNTLLSLRTNLHKRIIPIVNIVVNVLNLHYLQNLVGATHANCLIFYIIGLLIVDKKATMSKISETLLCCAHDCFYRMLAAMNFSMNALSLIMISFIEKCRRANVKGWLIIDDTSISKKFSQVGGAVGVGWCGCVGKVAPGIFFVALFWTDGRWRFPVGFRLWLPKKDKSGNKRKNYKTKVDLARELITCNYDFCRTCEYITFDSWYCSKKFLRLMRQLKLPAVSCLQKNRKIIFKKREMKIADLSVGFRGVVTLPGYGEVFVYCSKIGHKGRCLVSTDKRIKFRKLRKRYKRRWPIEEFFRVLKQNLGLADFQCRNHASVVNHITAVFLAYAVLEFLRYDYSVTHGKVKNMLQKKFYGMDEKILPLSVRRSILKHVA